MHLLHIVGTLDPAAGGVAESVRVLMKHAPPDCTGEVVTLDSPDAPFLKDLPFRVHALGPQYNVYGSNAMLVPWLKANRHRFHGVVVNGLWQSLGAAARRALAGHTPYIVITHGMLDPYFKRRHPLKHLKKWLYWLLVEYWVLRGAHRVLFTTQEESRLARLSFWLHRWSPAVVSYGASRPIGASPEAQRQAFFRACPAVEGKRFLLFLGRIHPKKGCDLLVDAFARLASCDPDLHLVMAGPDQQHWVAALRQKAHDAGIDARVHWPGMLQSDAKWGAYFASEAFILPSHQENFGLAVAEALACSRPVLLSTPVNIAAEIVADGAGLMEHDTLAGTEKLLIDWMKLSPAQRAEMGRCALACFDKRYNMDHNAAAICKLFKDVAPFPVQGTQHPDHPTLLGADTPGITLGGLMAQSAGILRPKGFQQSGPVPG